MMAERLRGDLPRHAEGCAQIPERHAMMVVSEDSQRTRLYTIGNIAIYRASSLCARRALYGVAIYFMPRRRITLRYAAALLADAAPPVA